MGNYSSFVLYRCFRGIDTGHCCHHSFPVAGLQKQYWNPVHLDSQRKHTLGIQSYSQLMIDFLSIGLRFHYHSQKVIGSLWICKIHQNPRKNKINPFLNLVTSTCDMFSVSRFSNPTPPKLNRCVCCLL